MNRLQRIIAHIFGISETLENMQKLCIEYDKDRERTRKNLYLPVEQPRPDEIAQFNDELHKIGDNRFFKFYMLAIESELVAILRDSKIDTAEKVMYQIRGQLQLINKMRLDFKAAKKSRIVEGDESDIILFNIDKLLEQSVN